MTCIERTLELKSIRQLSQQTTAYSKSSLLPHTHYDNLIPYCPPSGKYLHIVPSTNAIACTLSNGSRYFLRSHSKYDIKRSHSSLLTQSIFELNQSPPVDSSTPQVSSMSPQQDLWVTKYYPDSFSQLLSSEYVNRSVLKALKDWDPFIFHRDDIEPTADKSRESTESIPDKRPLMKLILIAGPPGTPFLS